jgi:hypothetical protein
MSVRSDDELLVNEVDALLVNDHIWVVDKGQTQIFVVGVPSTAAYCQKCWVGYGYNYASEPCKGKKPWESRGE